MSDLLKWQLMVSEKVVVLRVNAKGLFESQIKCLAALLIRELIIAYIRVLFRL